MTASEPRVLIYLLRRDLRVGDNPVFHKAAQAFRQQQSRPFTHLLPLYIFSPNQVEVSGFLTSSDAKSPFPEARSSVGGFWRCGPHRAKFLGQSIWDLKTSLEALNSGLCIRIGRPADVIENALKHFEDDPSRGKVVGVWMTGDVTGEEIDEQDGIKKIVESKGKEFKLFKDEKYFVDDDDLPFDKVSELQNVFTEFKRKLLPLRERPRATLPMPETLPPYPDAKSIAPVQDGFTIPTEEATLIQKLLQPLDGKCGLQAMPERPAKDIEKLSAHPFTGGETHGIARIQSLIQSGSISTYDKTRNGLVGSEFSTKLSAWLALGSLTARQIHHQMDLFENGDKAAHKRSDDDSTIAKYKKCKGFGQGENDGTAMVRFELLWRDYMRLCARKFGTKLFSLHGFSQAKTREWKQPDRHATTAAEDSDIIQRFLAGHTGIGLIDAAQRELFWTGYSSNRARQNTASFLAKDLKFDWRIGAEWFESMLVDYDVSSNWGNWQYVAGVGNDPRENRKFNPVKQAHDYDKGGAFITTWIPELRSVKYKDDSGRVDIDGLMGLFQAWTIPQPDAQQVGIANSQWYKDPLVKIEYDPRRTPRGNARRGGRGRGNGNANRGRGNQPRGGGGAQSHGRGGQANQSRGGGGGRSWRGAQGTTNNGSNSGNGYQPGPSPQ